MSTANTHKAKRDSRLDEVLGLATGHAKNELGDAENKSVTAAATLSASSTENDVKEDCGVNASVTLGATHSKTDLKAKK